MATIKTRPGNPDAPVPYGYLVLTEEDGTVNEEPISQNALIAIEEHFSLLGHVLELVEIGYADSGSIHRPPDRSLEDAVAILRGLIGSGVR